MIELLLGSVGSGLFFLVYTGGLTLALIRRHRLGKAAVLLITGCTMGLVVTVAQSVLISVVFSRLGATEPIHYQFCFAVVRLINAVSLSLIIAAAFVGRPRIPNE